MYAALGTAPFSSAATAESADHFSPSISQRTGEPPSSGAGGHALARNAPAPLTTLDEWEGPRHCVDCYADGLEASLPLRQVKHLPDREGLRTERHPPHQRAEYRVRPDGRPRRREKTVPARGTPTLENPRWESLNRLLPEKATTSHPGQGPSVSPVALNGVFRPPHLPVSLPQVTPSHLGSFSSRPSGERRCSSITQKSPLSHARITAESLVLIRNHWARVRLWIRGGTHIMSVTSRFPLPTPIGHWRGCHGGRREGGAQASGGRGARCRLPRARGDRLGNV